MKTILLNILLMAMFVHATAQQDPKAEPILDKTGQITQAYNSLKMDFTYEMYSLVDNSQFSQNGTLYIKENKYVIDFADSKIYYDGKSIYNFIPDANEVTITLPDEGYDEFFLNDPTQIFTFYKKDFKYKYIGDETLDGLGVYRIDLYPMSLDRSYSRVKLWIGKDDHHLLKTELVGKGGDRYVVTFTDYKVNQNLSDSFFVFDKSKHPGVEVIDMTDF